MEKYIDAVNELKQILGSRLVEFNLERLPYFDQKMKINCPIHGVYEVHTWGLLICDQCKEFMKYNPVKNYLFIFETKEERYIDYFYKVKNQIASWNNNYYNSIEFYIFDLIFAIEIVFEKTDADIQLFLSFGGNNENSKINFRREIRKDAHNKEYLVCILDMPYVIIRKQIHNVLIYSNIPFFGYRYKGIWILPRYKRVKLIANKVLFGDIIAHEGMYGLWKDIKKSEYLFVKYSEFEKYVPYNGIIVDLTNHKQHFINHLNEYKNKTDILEYYEQEVGSKLDIDLNSEYETKTKKLEMYLEYKYDRSTGLFLDSAYLRNKIIDNLIHKHHIKEKYILEF
jgi:hypothetical protein